MSHFRKTEISNTFTRWLERYSPPLQIRENPTAQQDEFQALLGVLLKMAPQNGYQEFITKALDTLEYNMKTRAWPTKSELGAALSNLIKQSPNQFSRSVSHVDMTPEAINARRIKNKQPVGEGYLYGEMAVDLIARGLIREGDLDGYRKGAFFARKSVYGEDAAIAWEKEAKQRHRNANMKHISSQVHESIAAE